ncbi:hypothetical protein DKK70_14940 [Gilliamella apicola]|uniref:Uncharacterized protein n=1 Tax=Gilliamella apicola TaxID=1196095 RepID=A0A2V4DWF3_9GAMM|nr:hypothetical protein [Gilliamella apicola]PXZ03879.1 hypothetical protein DKK70_14940 [Gilliamella apicola]
MKLIKAEEIEFFYIFPEDDLIKEETTLINDLIMPENWANLPMGRYTSKQLIEMLQNGADTRLAIFKVNARLATIPLKKEYDAYQTHCLFWTNKDINLKELDQKIKDDSYTDEDFSSAVIARLQYAFCRHCHNKYIALVCDDEIYTSMYFINIPKRVPWRDYCNKLNNYCNKKRGMIKIIRCPNCNELIGIYVARFFGKVEDGN